MNPQFSVVGHSAIEVQPHTSTAPPPPQVSEPTHLWQAAPPTPQRSWTSPGWQLPFASQQPLHIPFAVPQAGPHTPVVGSHARPSGQPAAEVHGTLVSTGGGPESKGGGLVSATTMVESTPESTTLVSGAFWTKNESAVASKGTVKFEQEGHVPLSASPHPVSVAASSATNAQESESASRRHHHPASRPTRPVDELDELPTLRQRTTWPRAIP
jgi:hypothetical protein